MSSFEPVARLDARVLILGSMPGVASLDAHQYYAHPRNAFWPILSRACGFDHGMDYPARLEAIQSAGLGLWDVLANCDRVGSLDGDILPDSMRVNDFAAFFVSYQNISAVLCNGGTAYRLFNSKVRKAGWVPRDVEVVQLPSTSPAYASMRVAEKGSIWLGALRRWLR